MQIVITGGAGFIGSHLVDKFLEKGHAVTVLDNLRTGDMSNLAHNSSNPQYKFVKCDLVDKKAAVQYIADSDMVFHFAANPEVREGNKNTDVDFDNNILVTRNVLEGCKQSKTCKTIVFASTSTVYGEPCVMPTPETWTIAQPISLYGASKSACETLISGYCHMFDLQGYVLRFANVIGPRSRHGVIYDFLSKLVNDPTRLEILGNGRQSKSYLHISDCIDGISHILEYDSGNVLSAYNIGSMDRIDVLSIGKIVVAAAGLDNVEFTFSDPEKNGRGWKGDVKSMLLDTGKISRLGWRPQYNSTEAVRLTTIHLINTIEKFRIFAQP